jgi:hypothetical protein
VNVTLCVSESCQDCQNWTVSNQLTEVERGLNVLGVTMNLVMCDREGSLYSVHATV